MQRTRWVLLAVVCLGAVEVLAANPVGTAFHYQGRLHDAGDPADGLYDMRFSLWDGPDAMAGFLGEVTLDDVTVTGGYFRASLDFGLNVFDGEERWLEVAVGPLDSSDPEDLTVLSPRQRLAPVPYALYAADAPAPQPPWVLLHEGAEPVVWAENAGEGRGLFGSSVQGCGVHGMSASSHGVYGTGSKGVYGLQIDSGNYGYLGSSDFGAYGRFNNGNWGALGVSNAGVFGETSLADVAGVFGSSPFGYGVRGASASKYGVYGTGVQGVRGEHPNSGNYGYLGHSDYGVYGRFNTGNWGALGTGNAGVFGQAEVADVPGVFGSSPFGYGVRGASASKYGVYGTGVQGVRGEHPDSGNYGYLGHSDHGVYGRFNNGNWGALGTGNAGVFGQAEVADLPGVFGSSPFGYGVRGASASKYGIYGTGAVGVYAENPSSGNKVALAGSSYLLDARTADNSIGAVLGAYKTGLSTFSYVPGGRGVFTVGEVGVDAMGDVMTGYGVKAQGYYGVHAESTEGFAGYFDGAVRIIGYRWNPATTDGDFSIGDGAHWFKIGVAVGGGGAGDVRLRSQGGTNRLILGSGTEDVMTVVNGGVGIRTLTPAADAALDVHGPIYQRGAKLHADYVFEEGYRLESIEEHAAWMWTHRHLPAIPQARTDPDGTDVVEVGAHRRGIVEELEKAHIYIEQLNRRNAELAAQNQILTERMNRLERLVQKLAAEDSPVRPFEEGGR